MGARETLPNPDEKTLYLEVLEQLKRRDEIVAENATLQIEAMKAQIDSEILPKFDDYLPLSGGLVSGSITTIADAAVCPASDESFIRFCGGASDPNTSGGNLILFGKEYPSDLYRGGAVLRSMSSRAQGYSELRVSGDYLYWNDSDLGRWAGFDPNLMMQKTGGTFVGIVSARGIYPENQNIAVFEVIAPAGSPNGQRIFLAGFEGISNGFVVQGNGVDGSILYNFSGAPGGAALYFDGNDLGRWARIDPNSKWSNNSDGLTVGSGNPGEKQLGMWNQRVSGYFFLSDDGGVGFYDSTSARVRFRTETDGSFSIGGALSAWTMRTTSDKRKKKNIIPINCALEKLKTVCGYEYTLTDNEQRAYGVISQETEKVLPYSVSERDGVKLQDYNAIIALLVNAVNELAAKLQAPSVA